ncbi:MAG: SDR family oxidoreductase [Rhodothermales bacterium]|nr:SDR family oxidoreductase [Rhodothermales bacterium]
MTIDLQGRIVLVTGGARGIGHAVSRLFAEANARVAVHYNRSKTEAGELAERVPGAMAFQADLTDSAAARQLFRNVLTDMGGLDVLINNAGLARKVGWQESGADWEWAWDETMSVNLKSAALLSRLALGHFVEHGGGRIVTVSSRAAFRGDTPEFMAYAASKAGLVGLTRSIARGFGKKGVSAFLVAPGFTRTDMAQEFIDEYGEDYAVSDIALSRLTEPEDVARIVVFLASGLADHATGCTVDVNAGSYVH